ncbi:MAG: TIGR03087 family PEP-CTERM/XrtA system glycosyltransferase, partial [Acetobacteraceae bacterium]
PDKGDKIRAFHLLEYLGRSFDIHLGCLADSRADLTYLPALQGRTASLACFPLNRRAARLRSLASLPRNQPLSRGYFYNAGLARWVGHTLANRPIAQLFVFSSSMAPYVTGVPDVPRILDMVDVDSEKFSAYAAQTHGPMRLLWAREARTLLRLERAAARLFDHTLFVSPSEEARFLERAPECAGRTGWVRNGVDLTYFSPHPVFPSPFSDGVPAIVFTGTMDYKPNIAAVTWFADAVMPLLAGREPPPLFSIVGSDPAPAVARLARRPNILVTGRVNDTRPFLAHASLVVAPLLIGRGIQNKVLEAMAMARPIIASPAALEGICATPGREVLAADDPPEVARLVGDILDGRHPHLGAAARQAAVRRHDWAAALARLDTFLVPSKPAAAGAVGASP